jgi:hypothetical protein
MQAFAAPARRVGFFFTDTTASVLNSNGWRLFDAAVNWSTSPPEPWINKLTNSFDSVGDAITLNGSNFGSTPGAKKVMFRYGRVVNNVWTVGFIEAPTASWSDTQVVALVPTGLSLPPLPTSIDSIWY